MDKERAKNLGTESEQGEPIETPCDDSAQKSSRLFTTPDGAPALPEPIESPCDNERRTEKPVKSATVNKRSKTAKKGEIAFD